MDILGRRDYFFCVLLASHTLPSVIGDDDNSSCTLCLKFEHGVWARQTCRWAYERDTHIQADQLCAVLVWILSREHTKQKRWLLSVKDFMK